MAIKKPYRRKILFALGGLFVIGVGIFGIVAFFPKQAQKKTPVTVGDISRQQVEAEVKKTEQFNSWVAKEKIPNAKLDTTFEKAEERVKEKEIAEDFAQKHGITVSQHEVETQFQKAAASIGGEEKYLEKLKEIYGLDKAGVYDMLSYDLLKQKISKQVHLPFAAWMKEAKAGQH